MSKIKIEIVKGKVSDFAADAYALPFFPTHVSPDKERNDVEHAGARGVRKFVDLRLQHQKHGNPLKLGDVYIMDSLGGKSTYLLNIVCRDNEVGVMKNAVKFGILGVLMIDENYGIKTVAMPPLCVSDGLTPDEFAKILKSVLDDYSHPIFIEKIIIATKYDDRYEALSSFQF